MGTLQNLSTRHPIWTFVVLVLVVGLAWLIMAPWPPGLEQAMGRKRIFLNAILSGITLGRSISWSRLASRWCSA